MLVVRYRKLITGTAYSLHLQAIYLAQRLVTQVEKGFTVEVTGGTQTFNHYDLTITVSFQG